MTESLGTVKYAHVFVYTTNIHHAKIAIVYIFKNYFCFSYTFCAFLNKKNLFAGLMLSLLLLQCFWEKPRRTIWTLSGQQRSTVWTTIEQWQTSKQSFFYFQLTNLFARYHFPKQQGAKHLQLSSYIKFKNQQFPFIYISQAKKKN